LVPANGSTCQATNTVLAAQATQGPCTCCSLHASGHHQAACFTCLQVHVVRRRKLLARAQLLQPLPSVRHQGGHLHALCRRHPPARRLHPAAAGRWAGKMAGMGVGGVPAAAAAAFNAVHATPAQAQQQPSSSSRSPAAHRRCSARMASRAVSGESGRPCPGAFFTGANSSSRRTCAEGGAGRADAPRCDWLVCGVGLLQPPCWLDAAGTAPAAWIVTAHLGSFPGAPPAARCWWPAGRCQR